MWGLPKVRVKMSQMEKPQGNEKGTNGTLSELETNFSLCNSNLLSLYLTPESPINCLLCPTIASLRVCRPNVTAHPRSAFPNNASLPQVLLTQILFSSVNGPMASVPTNGFLVSLSVDLSPVSSVLSPISHKKTEGNDRQTSSRQIESRQIMDKR